MQQVPLAATSAYGLWWLAATNAAVFIVFAASFVKPTPTRDWRANPHFGPFHLVSTVAIAGGFYLLYRAWRVLYPAQRDARLASEGPYVYIRHPQYAGFILILAGFLLQWPTLLTLAMFPVLVVMYVRLARREEREVERQFGDVYRADAARTPAFLPGLHRAEPDADHSL